MPALYRLTKARYSLTAFAGSRGRGRWHYAGTPVVYAADTPGTALLETLVHAGRMDLLTEPYVLFRIEAPEQLIVSLEDADLPSGWRAWPWQEAAQRVGTLWYEARVSAVLSVPSAVVALHRNYLLNPHHEAFAQLRITGPEPFEMDVRLG